MEYEEDIFDILDVDDGDDDDDDDTLESTILEYEQDFDFDYICTNVDEEEMVDDDDDDDDHVVNITET
jgi:hypothetical protein